MLKRFLASRFLVKNMRERAVYSAVHRLPGVCAGNRPVRAHAQTRTTALDCRKWVLPRCPRSTELRIRVLNHLWLICRAQRLNIGCRIHLGETTHIIGVDNLDMSNMVALF